MLQRRSLTKTVAKR